MPSKLSSCVVTAATVTILLAAARAPQKPRQLIREEGPYKVVVSKPIPPESWRAESVYTESAHLTAMFNQLAIDGLEPAFVQVYTEQPVSQTPQDRVMVVCRRP
ncbi:MAG: hypothetical protein ACON4Z_12660 [Planctomycetota bacterium]